MGNFEYLQGKLVTYSTKIRVADYRVGTGLGRHLGICSALCWIQRCLVLKKNRCAVDAVFRDGLVPNIKGGVERQYKESTYTYREESRVDWKQKE